MDWNRIGRAFLLWHHPEIFIRYPYQKLSEATHSCYQKGCQNTLLIGIDGQGIWNISEKGDTILHIYKEDLNNPFHSGVTEYMIFFATVQKLDSHIHRKAVFLWNNNSQITPVTYQINNPNSLGNNYVNQIIEDHEGHIWFATNNGVSRWDAASNKWKHYYQNKSEQAKVFLSLCEDNQGHIWAGSYSSGIYLLDRETGKRWNITPPRPTLPALLAISSLTFRG